MHHASGAFNAHYHFILGLGHGQYRGHFNAQMLDRGSGHVAVKVDDEGARLAAVGNRRDSVASRISLGSVICAGLLNRFDGFLLALLFGVPFSRFLLFCLFSLQFGFVLLFGLIRCQQMAFHRKA